MKRKHYFSHRFFDLRNVLSLEKANAYTALNGFDCWSLSCMKRRLFFLFLLRKTFFIHSVFSEQLRRKLLSAEAIFIHWSLAEAALFFKLNVRISQRAGKSNIIEFWVRQKKSIIIIYILNCNNKLFFLTLTAIVKITKIKNPH